MASPIFVILKSNAGDHAKVIVVVDIHAAPVVVDRPDTAAIMFGVARTSPIIASINISIFIYC